MLSFSWLRRTSSLRPANPVQVHHHQPEVEVLEDRVLLATITVDSTNDDTTNDTFVTLREAIESVNAGMDTSNVVATGDPYGTNDRIVFAIAGAGPHTIQPTMALPTITQAVHIDGSTQTGFAGSPLIELDGTNAGGAVDGLRITTNGTTIEALAINRFTGSGIEIDGTGSSGNVLLGNYIGTDVHGTADLGNNFHGVLIVGSGSNTLGGTASGARNLISGNNSDGVEINGAGSNGNVVLGNYIGTDVNGTADLGNSFDGVFISGGASSNTVGGTASGARNLISGNNSDGVEIFGTGSSGNVVLGNYIGTDVHGTADLGNSQNGVRIRFGSSSNTVGGTASGARNLISGNNSDGVEINGAGSNGNVVLGNYIGTDVNGTADLGNSLDGVLIFLSSNNTIGGTSTGARNLISGNDSEGITFSSNSSGNVVLGNYIGTDINGTTGLGNTTGGLVTSGDSNTIGGTVTGARNLISGNSDHGVEIKDGSSGNVLLGNYIGTDVHGTTDLGNNFNGVFISVGGRSNTVGGTATGAGNLISGNDSDGVQIDGTGSSGNVVLGNYIGTDVHGTANLGNTANGVLINGASSSTLGGTASGARNLISGNDLNGVEIRNPGSSGNVVLGNYIGTDVHGTADLGNSADGVSIQLGSSSNTIGGTATGAGNLISGNDSDGVQIDGTGSSGNVVLGNYIGTDVNGTADLGNSQNGVRIRFGSSSNTLGGTASGARNLISGNNDDGVQILNPGSSGNVVLGNYIGTDVNGTADLGNSGDGVRILNGSSSNTLGGTATGARNLISGNDLDGVTIGSSGNVVLGNFIGTDVNGTADLGNSRVGVFIVGSSSNTLGGTAAGARNLISANDSDGVTIGSSGNVVLGNYIGTDVNGTADLGNSLVGVRIFNGASNTLGGTASGARNLISGNTFHGVEINGTGSSGNVVLGNYIGTDVNGTVGLGNSIDGVRILNGSSSNTLGGTASGARNLISGNDFDGVVIDGAGSSGNMVLGNYIGTDTGGTADLSNTNAGVEITGGATANTVGGTAVEARNLISGNTGIGLGIFGTGTSGNVVAGNYIGTDTGGTTALPNGDGVEIGLQATANTIGGTAMGAGNLISGNTSNGVAIRNAGTSGNVVLGNHIGLDATGTGPLANGSDGVFLRDEASGNLIGGSAVGSGNVISGNTDAGVALTDLGTSGNVVAGNFIGTDTTGTAAIANGVGGVDIRDEASGNLIGGTAVGSANVISGNATVGVAIRNTGSSGNVVLGNYIGTDVNGTADLGNSLHGVFISFGASTNTVGGTASGARNLISGNDFDGVGIFGTGSSGNVVLGNFIGTDTGGTADLGNNFNGVLITDSATANTVGGTTTGAGNTIAFNGTVGVAVGTILADDSVDNSILGNSIFDNAALGIDLGSDGPTPNDPLDVDASPNRLQNFPDLTRAESGPGATVVEGTLNSTPGRTFRLEFFSSDTADPSGFGQGRTFLGSLEVTTDGTTGDVLFSTLFAVALPVGTPITATATDLTTGDTSEFSQFEAVVLEPPTVTINQALAQADPTNQNPIVFTVVFSETVTGFGPDDISFTGSTVGGSLSASVMESGPLDGTTFTVEVSGATGVGDVVASVVAGAAQDAAGNPSDASTSTDNTVLFDNGSPTVTINQATVQADPSNQPPIVFTVIFSETVTGFGPDDISFTGSTVGGSLSASITESGPLDGTTFTVEVSEATGVGNVVASVVAGAAQDAAGNPSEASTSTDNTVLFDDVSPTVTIEATDDPIDGFVSRTFTVTFSEPVFGFTSGDVGLGGTAGATTATVSGSGAVYTVTVTGMTQTGSITLTIPNGAAVDAASNANTEATLTVRFGDFLVTGAGEGGGPHVVVRDRVNDTVKFNFFAYGDGFTGGVRVATGDINGDGTLDIITAAGPGGGSHVRIFDGNDLSVINEFFAYVNGFTGGVFVASGDVNGDGIDDVITGAGAGGTTHVRVFGGGGAGTLAEFFAYDPAFTGGVQVAVGDVDGDGRADIVTGAGPGGTPLVKVVDALSANLRDESGQIQDAALLTQFFAYDAAFAGGVFVASGDVTGDGLADILTGAGPSGGPHVKLIDATRVDQLEADGVLSDAALLANFFAYEPPFSPPELVLDPPYMEGVRVGIEALETDGTAAIVTAPGSDAILPVRVRDLPTLAESDSFFAFEDFGGGVFVS